MSIGKFIVFEGLDNVGKTSHSKNLLNRLAHKGIPVMWTSEPFSETEWPEKVLASKNQQFSRNIMEVLKTHTNAGDVISSMARTLIWCVDRAQHIDTFIKPHLEEGTWVICDRYWYSTGAYQVYAGDVYQKGREFKWDQLVSGLDMPKPDMCFLLTANKATIVSDFENNRFTGDKSKEDAWSEAERYYKRVASLDSEVWREILDTRNRPIDEVFDEIYGQLKAKFQLS